MLESERREMNPIILQKPLSLAEIQALKCYSPMWVEFKEKRVFKGECQLSILIADNGKYIECDNGSLLTEKYQKSYRCWLTRPTNAEREAASWEE